jgi:hypothetical protein
VGRAVAAHDATAGLAAAGACDYVSQFAESLRRDDRPFDIGVVQHAADDDRATVSQSSGHGLALDGITVEHDDGMTEVVEIEGGRLAEA